MQASRMPRVNARYWLAITMASLFGTNMGDLCSHIVGEGLASLGLGALHLITLAIWSAGAAAQIWLYWLVLVLLPVRPVRQ